jgi:Exostosin family
MKIFAYQRPAKTKFSRPDFSLTISPFTPAVGALWDDVDPAEADYLMVPFTFKAQVPGLPWRNFYNVGDVMLPFIFKSEGQLGWELRDDLRTRIVRTFLSELDHYDAYPEKHIFIDNADVDQPCILLRDSILFKTNAQYRDANVLPLAYPFPDPGPPSQGIENATLDVSFQGHVPMHPIRQSLKTWSKAQSDSSVEFREMPTSFYMANEEQRSEMAREYWELMLRSKFVLCPRGVGPSSRRFFETLAMGRIPVVVGDSCKLPLESVIEYGHFVVRVPEGFVGRTGDYIRAFEMSHDLIEASKQSRQAYVEYFAPERFRDFIEVSLNSRTGLTAVSQT